MQAVPSCLPSEHYEANRRRYIDQARAGQQALRVGRRTYSVSSRLIPASTPVRRIPALEFDHLGNKAFNIGQALSYRSGQSILDEIEQCEVVCADCNRRRTASAERNRPRDADRELGEQSGRRDSNPLFDLGRVMCNR
jgi:hypothetical protein